MKTYLLLILTFASAQFAFASSDVTHHVLVRDGYDIQVCSQEITAAGFDVVKVMPLIGIIAINTAKPVESLKELSCVEIVEKNLPVVIGN